MVFGSFHMGLNSDLFCTGWVTSIGKMFTWNLACYTDVTLGVGAARICNLMLIFLFKIQRGAKTVFADIRINRLIFTQKLWTKLYAVSLFFSSHGRLYRVANHCLSCGSSFTLTTQCHAFLTTPLKFYGLRWNLADRNFWFKCITAV